jgi:hypothetical protein
VDISNGSVKSLPINEPLAAGRSCAGANGATDGGKGDGPDADASDGGWIDVEHAA